MSVIKARNISKKYTIYHEPQAAYSTLVETLTRTARRWVHRLRHPLEPSTNRYEEFWALQDVSFDIEEGDRVGIIGRNGAGKSTLLKILSRITYPTSGEITIKGRLSSLLEVGTGFHPELTGRENIFLNGAILGMRQQEIRRKFDEIVAFAEVEKFLDTPVKRFSSGMYARLGFAIAAHLDPDLLIVDEVLAVGDIAFQEKCFNKLSMLSEQGRTILFVTHDPAALLRLCNKGIFLENGRVHTIGPVEQCVNVYMRHCHTHSLQWQGNIGDEHIRFTHAGIDYLHPDRDFFFQHEKTHLTLEYEVLQPTSNLIFGIGVWNHRNQLLGHAHICDDPQAYPKHMTAGKHALSFQLDPGLFHEGEYSVKLDCFIQGQKKILNNEISLKFVVYPPQESKQYKQKIERSGIFLGNHWRVKS